MAYLTHSQYGRNGKEVTINNNSNYITGIAGDTVAASESTSIENTYNTSSGAWEYTAGWDTLSSSSFITSHGKAIDGTVYFSTNGESDRTKTAYRNGTYDYDGEKIKEVCRTGDGIKETWISGYRSWFNDYSYCVYSYNPFSVRGGYYYYGGTAGVFYSYYYNGGLISFGSFRAVLARGV